MVPSGEVTFWFSDIEGSTRLWEQHPREMAQVLERHFELLREIHERHGGKVIEGTGDGIYTVFSDAAEAVLAAIEVQQACMAEDWGVVGDVRCRVGLHTGRAAVQGSAYHGAEVNRTARLMSTGHGGQILLSGATHALVSDDPLSDVAYEFMGRHELKDLDRPVAIWQVLHPDLPTEFPPLKSRSVSPNNLPLELSSLVGRDRDLALVGDLVQERILVTLVGPTGVGKSRLALHVAAEELDRQADGVWLVDLSELSDPADVLPTMAAVLGIGQASDSDLLDEIGDHLRLKDVLIVLDGCERVVDEAARVVAALLRRCATLNFLVTSQIPLEVEGEVAWPVTGLAVPALRDDVTFEDWEEWAALRLFVERAHEARPTWDLTPDNLADVVGLVRHLDGLPLALEIAAIRSRVLSVADLRAKVDHERFRVLRGGLRSGKHRHRTLEDALRWGYDLLEGELATVFCRLGTFLGSFPLEAAEHVGARGEVDTVEVLDAVAELVDRSLLDRLSVAGETRYRMLESTQRFARSLLDDDEFEATSHSHLDHFLHIAREAERGMRGADQPAQLRRVHADIHNVEQAMAWAISAGRIEDAARLAADLHVYWWVRDPHRGYRHLVTIVDLLDDGIADVVEAEALLVAGALREVSGDLEQATDHLTRALEMGRVLSDPELTGRSAYHLARARYGLDEPKDVRKLLDEAVEALRSAPDLPTLVETLVLLGRWDHDFADGAELDVLTQEAARLAHDAGVPRVMALGDEALAYANLIAGNSMRVTPRLREALDIYGHLGDEASIARCVEFIADWATQRGQLRRAGRLLGATGAARERLGLPARLPWGREETERALHEQLGPLGTEEVLREGARLDLGGTLQLAHETLNRLAV